jgi:hypothetical protein
VSAPPSGLERLAEEIRAHEAEAHAHAARALAHKLAIGQRLLEAKQLLPHGAFVAWGREQFGWTQQHLYNHMDLARNHQRVGDLPPDTSLRLALAVLRGDRTRLSHAEAHERRLAAVEAGAGAVATAAGGGWPVYGQIDQAEAGDYCRRLAAAGVRAHTAVTSPAYWALREYTHGDPRELGREPAPEAYVADLCAVVDAIGRVLIPEGVLLLNLGDTYANEPGGYRGDPARARGVSAQAVRANGTAGAGRVLDVPEKSLCLIPERVALELSLRRGWRVAARIAWVQLHHAPEHVYDRPAQGWEFLYVLTRAEHCYWRRRPEEREDPADDWWWIKVGRGGAADGHLAPFPEDLVERALRHACPEGGVVLDPFAGSGTVRDVAHRMGRRFLGCDLLGEPEGAG